MNLHRPVAVSVIVTLSLGAGGGTLAGDVDVTGTWKLLSSVRKVVATGETSNSYGDRPTGWLTYGPEGRMTFIAVYNGRPRPESIAKTTDEERIRLYNTMVAYSGTYSVSGSIVTHRTDTSWNEVWTGDSQIRDLERRGDRLVLTTRPAPFSGDGRESVVTLTFEKVK